MKFLRIFTVSALSVLLVSAFAFASNDVDENRVIDRDRPEIPEINAMWDLLWGPIDLEIPTGGDNRQLGCEFDGEHFWTTGASDMTQTYTYRWDTNWNLLNTYLQPTHSTSWGWRDMVFDGTHLYASVNSNLDEIDPATGVWTGNTIPGPQNPNRALGYNAQTDHFFTANFSSNIYEFDRSGAIINSWGNTFSAYGMAWEDECDVDDDYLWVHHQAQMILAQFDIVSGTYTGVTFDCEYVQPLAIAGGAAFYNDATAGKWAFMVLGQGTPDFTAAWEYCDAGPQPPYQFSCSFNILTPRVPSIGGTIFFDISVTNTGSDPWPVYAEIYPTIGDCATGTPFDFNMNRMMTANLASGDNVVGNYFYNPGDVSGMGLSGVAINVDVGRAIDDWACSACDEFTFYNPFGRTGSPNATWNTEFFERGDMDVNMPIATSLGQNYPNPFNATTNIPFNLAVSGNVNLKVYNLAGQLIETLVDGQMDAGNHVANWDASTISSGVYFYVLKAGDNVTTKKMNLLK